MLAGATVFLYRAGLRATENFAFSAREYHKTRDILHVKETLGHKSLNSTMMYTQLISFRDDEYTVAVAYSEEEIVRLAEAGFEFYCNYEKNKIVRKRK